MPTLDKKFFRKLIIFQALISGLVGFKYIFFPYSFAPAELSKAMLLFDDMQPIPDIVTIIFLFTLLVIIFLSIIKLYQFKNIGRILYIVSIGGTLIAYFSSTYYGFDMFEMLLEFISSLNSGLILGIIYFSKLSKNFK